MSYCFTKISNDNFGRYTLFAHNVKTSLSEKTIKSRGAF